MMKLLYYFLLTLSLVVGIIGVFFINEGMTLLLDQTPIKKSFFSEKIDRAVLSYLCFFPAVALFFIKTIFVKKF